MQRVCVYVIFFFLMIRRPPRSTLFPYNDALPICWVPVMIATYPGNWAYDAGVEIKYYQLYGAISLHHPVAHTLDRKSTRLNSSHANISYAVFCLKKKNNHLTLSLPSQYVLPSVRT